MKRYLNDCPQRNVVLMQSSLRLTGSLRHSEKAPTVMIKALAGRDWH